MSAVYINGTKDPNGNNRRAWVIFNDYGLPCDFVEEGPEGPSALSRAGYKEPSVNAEAILVALGTYRKFKKEAERRKKRRP